jgi:hypothetical protein
VEEWFDFSTRHFYSRGFISQETLDKRLGGFTDILDVVVTPLPGIETDCEILSALLHHLNNVITDIRLVISHFHIRLYFIKLTSVDKICGSVVNRRDVVKAAVGHPCEECS